MKLVCFSNQTCGGLVCDLLNNVEFSYYQNYHIISNTHGLFKIGDSREVFRIFDEAAWLQKLDRLNLLVSTKKLASDDMYFGTHCHPSCIPEKYLNMFDKIIAITTETTNSKLLRFIRTYHGIFKMLGGHGNGPPNGYVVQDDSYYFTEKFDELKQFCRWTIVEFESTINCINVEFEDIINGKFVDMNRLNIELLNAWKEKNSFMYEPINPFLLNMFNETLQEIATYEKS